MATTTSPLDEQYTRKPRGIVLPGILLGLGLGGLIDGIVLHQILQWHHMGTSRTSFPATTVRSLQDNTLWDGLFHLAAWLCVIAGLFHLWHAARQGRHADSRGLTGLLLVGWGLFDVIEGIIDHQILGIHHVRDDIGGPIAWDLGFLGFGFILIAVGLCVYRSGTIRTDRIP